MNAVQKLPCGCYAEMDADGFTWVTGEAFLCEAGHKQGDLVEVREGQARVRENDSLKKSLLRAEEALRQIEQVAIASRFPGRRPEIARIARSYFAAVSGSDTP